MTEAHGVQPAWNLRIEDIPRVANRVANGRSRQRADWQCRLETRCCRPLQVLVVYLAGAADVRIDVVVALADGTAMSRRHRVLVSDADRTVARDVRRPVVPCFAVGIVAHAFKQFRRVVNERDRRELVIGQVVVSEVTIPAFGVQAIDMNPSYASNTNSPGMVSMTDPSDDTN